MYAVSYFNYAFACSFCIFRLALACKTNLNSNKNDIMTLLALRNYLVFFILIFISGGDQFCLTFAELTAPGNALEL